LEAVIAHFFGEIASLEWFYLNELYSGKTIVVNTIDASHAEFPEL
jgi:hypothetical protein